MNHATPHMSVHDQAVLAITTIRQLLSRGVDVLEVELGRCQKPVIRVAYNRAAGQLKDAESHVVCKYGPETFDVMVTDYRGCQVEWTEERGARHDG